MSSLPEVLVGLNDEQLAVALCDTNCMVIAGPGSGKTNTVARKAALLLSDPDRRVGAVTFTKEAAVELRERIVRFAGMDVAPRLHVGTFHGTNQLMSFPQSRKGPFAAEIFRGARSPFGTTPWKVVAEGTRRQYMLRAMADLGLELELDVATRIIEQIKSGNNPQELVHEQFVKAYTEIMERNERIDFQDILIRTNKGLRERLVSPLNVTDLIIDEYQDTDNIQFSWAAVHNAASIRMTGVGDDDQSIYAFRDALGFAGMERFATEFNAQRLMLGRNYRSHSEILLASGNVIGNNVGRIDKTLVSNKGPGGAARWRAFKSRNDEAFNAASLAAEALQSGQSVGILTRNNRRLDLVESVLSARDIPYRRPPGESILNQPEVAVFGAAVRYVIEPEPRGLDTLLSWCGVSESDLRGLHKAFGGNLALGNVEDFKRHGVSEEAKKKWRDFVRLYNGWQHTLAAKAENLLIRGVFEWLVSSASPVTAKGSRDSGVEKRLEIAMEIFQPRPAEPDRKRPAQSIRDRLAALDRAEVQNRSKAEDPTPKVDLMTAHGSKGLEFDVVWILGAEDEVFPAKDAGMEEERRLMYVAMTRARRDLTISTGGGKPPSPFITESGVERVQDEEPVAA